MNKTSLIMRASAIIMSGMILSACPVWADENVSALKAQIGALQKRVEELESDRWDPMAEMERWFTGRSGLLNSNMLYDENFEIKDNQDHYLISLDMQGFDKNKVDIQIDPHSVTISGQQSSQSKEEGHNGYYSSHSYGSFLRTLPLPADADTHKVQTKKEGGKLIITISKKT